MLDFLQGKKAQLISMSSQTEITSIFNSKREAVQTQSMGQRRSKMWIRAIWRGERGEQVSLKEENFRAIILRPTQL